MKMTLVTVNGIAKLVPCCPATGKVRLSVGAICRIWGFSPTTVLMIGR